MKKLTYLLIFALTLIGFTSCGEAAHSVKGVFDEFEQSTSGISFKLILINPENEITGGVFFDLENTSKSSTHTTNKEYDKEKPNDVISITGLTAKDTYKLTVKVAIGRKLYVVGEKVFVFGTNTEISITTPQDFMAMRSDLSANYTLGSDIDFEGITFVYPFSSAYKGTFDGNGYTLSNINISPKNADGQNVSYGHVGVFGYVSTGTIKNVTIKNLTLGTEEEPFAATGTTTTRLSFVVSMLSSTGVIENVTVDTAKYYYKTTTSVTTPYFYFGGIVAEASGTVKNVKVINSEVNLNVVSSAETYIGGVIGKATNDSKLSNLTSDLVINYSLFKDAKPSKTSTNDETISKDKNIIICVGGVIGQNISLVQVVGLYSTSTVNVTELTFYTHKETTKGNYYVYVGGLVGLAKYAFKDAYFDGTVSVNYTKHYVDDPSADDPDTTEVETGVIDADANAKLSFFIGLLTGEFSAEKTPISSAAAKGTINNTIETDTNVILHSNVLFGTKTKNTKCVVGVSSGTLITLYEHDSTDYYLETSSTVDLLTFFTSKFIRESLGIEVTE